MSKLVETSEHFEIKVCLRQGCVMSPCLFSIYMDGVMREMKGKVGEVGVRMYTEGRKRKLKVSFSKSEVMVCEQSRSEVVDFVCPYRVGIECEKECKIILNGEEMEEVNEFKDLG